MNKRSNLPHFCKQPIAMMPTPSSTISNTLPFVPIGARGIQNNNTMQVSGGNVQDAALELLRKGVSIDTLLALRSAANRSNVVLSQSALPQSVIQNSMRNPAANANTKVNLLPSTTTGTIPHSRTSPVMVAAKCDSQPSSPQNGNHVKLQPPPLSLAGYIQQYGHFQQMFREQSKPFTGGFAAANQSNSPVLVQQHRPNPVPKPSSPDGNNSALPPPSNQNIPSPECTNHDCAMQLLMLRKGTNKQNNTNHEQGPNGNNSRSGGNVVSKDGTGGPCICMHKNSSSRKEKKSKANTSKATSTSPTKSRNVTRVNKSNCADETISKRSRTIFNSRLDELAKFKENHGHCNVPLKYPSLGFWCARVRKSYRDLQEGKPKSEYSMPLNAERIERLEDLGFEWFGKKTFEQRLEELQTFKTQHGHCRVPVKGYGSLRFWCYRIRVAYKNLKNGEPQPRDFKLNADRIKVLEEMGFEM